MTTIRQTLEKHADRIVSDYHNGRSMADIAREFNCNQGTVWYFFNGLDIPTRSPKNHEHTFDVLGQKVKELYHQGISAYETSRRLNIHVSTVCRWLNRIGLDSSRYSKLRNDTLTSHKDEIIASYKSGQNMYQLAVRFDCNASSIYMRLVKWGVELRDKSKYSSDESFFDVIDTELKAYVLGLFYSDGNNMKENAGVRITNTDEEIIDVVKTALCHTGPVYKKKKRSDRHKQQYDVVVHSKRLSLALEQKGCPPKKTFVLRFPTEEQVPAHLVRHFVRGYFDGDGCVGCYGKNKRWSIQILGTRHVMDGIAAAAGIHPCYSQRHPERGKDNWTIHVVRHSDLIKLINWMYQDSAHSLARKREKSEECLRCIYLRVANRTDGNRPGDDGRPG